jgi:serine protease AprX
MRMPSRARRALASVAALALLSALPAARAATPASPDMSPRFARDIQTLPPDAPYRAFVHLDGSDPAERASLLDDHRLFVAADLASVDVVYATGEAGDFAGLVDEPSVTYLEHDAPIELFAETAPWATRARVAQESVAGGPYFDPSGAVLDGSGIGVAVVDSGIMSSHPDLTSRVAGNWKSVCRIGLNPSSWVGGVNGSEESVDVPGGCVVAPAKDSDLHGGHGTHVAGIVAGDGTASNGVFRGVAPAATLYGFSIALVPDLMTIAQPAIAFDHILTNFDDRSVYPTPVRIVTNSWGRSGSHAPESVEAKLVDALVAKGVTVVFAAGNNFGDGTHSRTNMYSVNPTPGVISVANYDDREGGARNGVLAASSSRGAAGQPESYPDVSAPGTAITAACMEYVQPLCGIEARYAPFYSRLSGTSMATPHVAGIAALLYQAVPSITPAQVEDVLQDTAHKFTFGAAYEPDPQNAGGTHSFDKGAGLVDAVAALNALTVPHGGVDQGPFTLVTDPADYPLLGAADVLSLTATEEPTGMRYALTVRNAADVGPIVPTTLRVLQNVGGRRATSIQLTSAGAQVPPRDGLNNTAVASDVTLAGNTVSFLLTWAELGNPGPNEPAFGVRVQTSGAPLDGDAAPGLLQYHAQFAPEFGNDYTIHPQ